MPHIHEKIDFTVEVFIVYKNKVLLRKHDKYKIWLAVGGHIELDEDPNQAAVREVKEEVGLDVELYDGRSHVSGQSGTYIELIPPMFMNRHRINPTHEHVSLVYFATSNTDKLVLSETEKSEECKWLTANEVESSKEIKPEIKHYALKALDTLKE
jgi:ADP-ribose pyrophosphatase YjhB (NUDIX family)